METQENEVLATLHRQKLIHKKGHYVLSSGGHSEDFVETEGFFTDPIFSYKLCCQLAHRFTDANLIGKIQVVVGAAKNGIVLAHVLGRRFNEYGQGERILTCFAEKNPQGGFSLSPTFARVVKGKNVAVADDTIITGGTIDQTCEAVAIAGGEVIAVAAILNRGEVTARKFGVPHLLTLAGMPLVSWSAKHCPMCKRGMKVNTDYGYGQEFLSQLKQK